MSEHIGVLIMAYGGPNSVDEIAGYLSDIRAGRVTTPAVLKEITRNYEAIGGKSPLLEFSSAQADAVAARLDDNFRCYLGMRHWSPWIEDVVRSMIDDGIERAVSIVLAPHYSSMSVARYQDKIRDGLTMAHGTIDFEHVTSYHDAVPYIEALAQRVRGGIAEFKDEDDVHVVFSAHSLPERIIAAGDPYDSQCRQTASLVAAKAELDDASWSWSYQSAGRSPEPWLGPQIDEHVRDLAARGVSNIVSVPVGFVSDHVEILYDIDIQTQEVARENNVRLVRPPALNNDPLFIDTLVHQIEQCAARAGWWSTQGVS